MLGLPGLLAVELRLAETGSWTLLALETQKTPSGQGHPKPDRRGMDWTSAPLPRDVWAADSRTAVSAALEVGLRPSPPLAAWEAPSTQGRSG